MYDESGMTSDTLIHQISVGEVMILHVTRLVSVAPSDGMTLLLRTLALRNALISHFLFIEPYFHEITALSRPSVKQNFFFQELCLNPYYVSLCNDAQKPE